MEIEVLGKGEPEYAVTAGVHGDETAAVEALEKLRSSDIEFSKAVKTILVNEKALGEGSRFIDRDLNRCFPGDVSSEEHEERLAAELLGELDGLKVIDMHTTSSKHSPFIIVGNPVDGDVEMARSTGIDKLIDMTYVEGGIGNHINGVVVESTKGPNAAKELFDILTNFLAAEGVIDSEFEKNRPEFYKVYDMQEGSNYEFTAKNFEKVEAGEVYAEKPGESLRAERSFYPVLMSTDGYESMIGFKADKKEI